MSEPVFKDYRTFVGSREGKIYKTTLFQSDRLMLGLNCLAPGQVQHIHDHADQDKFYHVLEGEGLFTVGDLVRSAGPGITVWAAAGIPHGVENQGVERLTIFMGMAPAPGK